MPTGQLHNAESPQAAAEQRLGGFSSAFALSLFVNDQLRISAVFLIGADQQKIHVCGKAQTAAAAVFTLQLIAEVGRLIVKELYGFSVGKSVFQIDIPAHERSNSC